MSITQANALLAIRARLDEPTSQYWTETDLRRWINEIAKDMARRTESLRGTYSQAAVAGTAAYTPAFTATTQMYRIYGIDFIPTGQTLTYPLEYRDRQGATEVWGIMQDTQGIPAIWTSWGAPPSLTIQVYPSPSIAGTLKLYYYRLPTELAITDTSDASDLVDIVDGWEDVLVDGVEYKAKRRDGDSTWTEAKQEYEQHLEAMMEATLRFTEAAGQISTPNGGFIPSWLYGGGEW
jgi:hypothetical protein